MSESQRIVETLPNGAASDAEEARDLVTKIIKTTRLNVEKGLDWIGRHTGVSRSAAWGFYHNRRKTAEYGTIRKLRAAYLALTEKQLAHLVDEIQVQRAKGRTDAAFEDIAGKVAALVVEVAVSKRPTP